MRIDLTIRYAFSVAVMLATLSGCMDKKHPQQPPEHEHAVMNHSLRWSNSFGGPGLARYTSAVLRANGGKIQWKKEVGGFIQGAVPFDRSIALTMADYTTTPDGKPVLLIRSISSDDGSTQWSMPLQNATTVGLPVYAGNDCVIVQTTYPDRQLITLVKNAEKLWSHQFTSSEQSLVNTSMTGDLVFLSATAPDGGQSCAALKRSSGQVAYEITDVSVPVSTIDDMTFAASRKGFLISYNSKTGAEKWRREYAVSQGLFAQGSQLCWVDKEGFATALNLETDRLVKVYKLTGKIVSWAVGDSYLLLAFPNEMVAISLDSQKVIWRLRGQYDNLAASKDNAVLASRGKDIVLLDGLNAKELWAVRIAGSILSICVADDGQIIIPTQEGEVYSIR